MSEDETYAQCAIGLWRIIHIGYCILRVHHLLHMRMIDIQHLLYDTIMDDQSESMECLMHKSKIFTSWWKTVRLNFIMDVKIISSSHF